MSPRKFDLPATLPLFTLPGGVLMPRTRLPLNIFEPRYLQMVEDALKTPHRLIGMIQPLDEAEALAGVGSAGRIVGFAEQENGRYMISLAQCSRFRLTRTEQSFAPYLIGHVDWDGFAADMQGGQSDPGLDRGGFLALVRRYLEAHDLEPDLENARDADAEMLVNSLAMALPFDVGDKQALLEAPSLSDRRRLLEGLMEFALRGGDGDEAMQ